MGWTSVVFAGLRGLFEGDRREAELIALRKE